MKYKVNIVAKIKGKERCHLFTTFPTTTTHSQSGLSLFFVQNKGHETGVWAILRAHLGKAFSSKK